MEVEASDGAVGCLLGLRKHVANWYSNKDGVRSSSVTSDKRKMGSNYDYKFDTSNPHEAQPSGRYNDKVLTKYTGGGSSDSGRHQWKAVRRVIRGRHLVQLSTCKEQKAWTWT